MSTPHVLLSLLAAGPRHGYELKRAHDTRLPQAKPLAFGQVYATLGRLERDGLVRPLEAERDSGPDRTAYELTAQGQAQLRHWLGEVEPVTPYVSSVLFAKVVVALLAADTEAARSYLIAQRAAHMTRLRELTAIKIDPASQVGDVIAADYAIEHIDADLRWLTATLDRVADLYEEIRS